jgi:hypothetical protein
VLGGGVAVAGLVLALVLILGGNSSSTPEPTPPGPKQPTTPAPLALITRFQVSHYVRQPDAELVLPRGDLGEKSFAVRWNDQVRLHVELSRLACVYLLAFNADGKEQLLWPEQEEQPPAPLAELDFPTSKGNGWTLDDEKRGGVQAFVVVAGKGRLPAYAVWKESRPKVSWKRIAVSGREEVVWRGNDVLLDPWLPGGVRGKTEELGGTGSLVGLARTLRQSPEVAEVSLLAMPVWPK